MVNKHLISKFGKRIRELREDLNLSQEQLSFATGFHRTYIGMIERGERNISLTNMAVFAKVFKMDLSDLLNHKPLKSFKNYEIKTQK
jgi:transcriptional regulator with XRE-family HTH domain